MAKEQTALQLNPSSSPSHFSPFTPKLINKQRPHLFLIMVLCVLVLLLTACGPEQSAADDEALVAETQRIAQEFVDNGDLEAARSQLSALDVANANLWLVLVTENAIGQNPEIAAPLVQLSESLGLESAQIERFAIENNLLGGLSALMENSPAAVAQVAPAAVAIAPQPTDAANRQTGSATAGEPQVEVVDDSAGEDSAVDNEVVADEAAETEGAAAEDVENDDAADDGTGAEESESVTVELPTPTPEPEAVIRATLIMNVRNGPGITYAIVGSLDNDEEAQIIGKNEAGDWWEVDLGDGQTGWVYGQLVETSGDLGAIAVVANIPPPPQPTATPQPLTEAPAPAAEEAPAEEAPAEEAPAEEAPAVDPNAGPHFTLIERRLWGKQENDGCVGKHLLRIHVIDANGVRINGVALQGIYVGEVLVTGSQGKGDGVIEYDLHGSGEGFRVMRNDDGRDATSDNAEGFTTRSVDIDKPTLIAAGYCSDEGDCDIFYSSWGCQGHHSWEATFQRNY